MGGGIAMELMNSGNSENSLSIKKSMRPRGLRSLSSARESFASSTGFSSKAGHSLFASTPTVAKRLLSSSESANLNVTGGFSYPGTEVHSTVPSYVNTPRSSILNPSTSSAANNVLNIGIRGERVDLQHVYKVVRFYSFWKTCTSFHRIVTMIERVGEKKNLMPAESIPNICTPTSSFSNIQTSPFTKRLFVQYLWRNAKPLEKSRVQKEFDPRRQRLLKFVTDPAARKRVSH